MRITLAELHKAGTGPVTLLEILSIEGQKYMARLNLGDQTLILSDPQGRTRLFRSSWEILDTLSDLEIHCSEVVHNSAYNEMVGMAPSPVDPLRIRIQGQPQ
ncbi:DUF6482 family protein [Marinobacter bryozoorum]|uniref:DUF6482 family protein n=1 Tax=Marinobacter bryozoorum TaxID=256324 RepID=UPI002005C50F|nr:DUF6482 family protein [Marinobacter bryozoorum]